MKAIMKITSQRGRLRIRVSPVKASDVSKQKAKERRDD